MNGDLTWISDSLNKALVDEIGSDFPIAWKNIKFIPTQEQMWLKAIFIPASDYSITLGPTGYNELVGMYQINVMSPLDSGSQKALGVIARLRNLFYVGKQFSVTTGYMLRIRERSYSSGGQTTMNDFGQGGVDGIWDTNFITVYWSAREPRKLEE